MTWEGINRRKFPRIMYPCMIRVFSKEEGQEVLLTHTQNIGQGGCSIIVRKELKLFSPLSVEIDLMDEEDHVLSDAHVVWIVRRKAIETQKPLHYDVGIEFEDIKQKDLKRLKESTENLIRKGYKAVKPIY